MKTALELLAVALIPVAFLVWLANVPMKVVTHEQALKAAAQRQQMGR